MDRMQASEIVRQQSSTLAMAFAPMRPFSVQGREYTALDIVQQLVIDPGGLDVAAATASAWVSYWGVVSADCKRAYDHQEAQYRVARDVWATKRRAEGKLTKDALDEEWRVQPGYLTWDQTKGEYERTWNCAQFVYEAHLRRTTMITALARMYGDERATQNPGRVSSVV